MRVLTLNRSYIPIRLATIYSTIGKLYCDVVEAIIVKDGQYSAYNFDEWVKLSSEDCWPADQKFLHSSTARVAIPTIVRCLKYDKIPKVSLRLTRRAIYDRDDHTCYLCGKQFSEGHLTLDHVIPSSRGGKNEWVNLATCCKECNENKDDKLLSELHLKPKFMPYKPVTSNMAKLKQEATEYCPEWAMFGL
jgi:5-methylcytosine-specific restriction endonuclease McrA